MEWIRRKPKIVCGVVRTGCSTKSLLPRLAPGQIIVIHHDDLDEVAAQGIAEAKVACIINAGRTMSGKYPARGAIICLERMIPIVEIAPDDFHLFQDGKESTVYLDEHRIVHGDRQVLCRPFTIENWRCLFAAAERRLPHQLLQFIDNTLAYASEEKHFFARPLSFSNVRCSIKGRHALLVARGNGYKHDLKAIRQYIADCQPVLIGVDGGADALLECGWKPQLIVGDMDSISDAALRSGAELVVHAFPDGRAPGMERVRALGLDAQIVRAPGTSEDIAMLLAYEKQANLIVTLGTHTHMIDFLEKGRNGMASTMLVRMKIGAKVIDAKGVSMLYKPRPQWKLLWPLSFAGFFPAIVIAWLHPGVHHYFRMLYMYVKLLVT